MPIYKEDIYILIVSDKEGPGPFFRMYSPFKIDHKRSRGSGKFHRWIYPKEGSTDKLI